MKQTANRNSNSRYTQNTLKPITDPQYNYHLNVFTCGTNVKNKTSFIKKRTQKASDGLLLYNINSNSNNNINYTHNSAMSDNSLYYQNYLDNLRKENKYYSNKHSRHNSSNHNQHNHNNNKKKTKESNVGNTNESLSSSESIEVNAHNNNKDKDRLSSGFIHQPMRSSGEIQIHKRKSNMKGKTPYLKSEKRLQIKEMMPPPVSRNSLFNMQFMSHNEHKRLSGINDNKIVKKRHSNYLMTKNDDINQLTPKKKKKRSNSAQKIVNDNNGNGYSGNVIKLESVEDIIWNNRDKEIKLVLGDNHSPLLLNRNRNEASNKGNQEVKMNTIKQEQGTKFKGEVQQYQQLEDQVKEKEQKQQSSTIKQKRHFFFCCIPIK